MNKILYATAILILILAVAILLTGCKSWQEQLDECAAKGGHLVRVNESGGATSGYLCVKLERL